LWEAGTNAAIKNLIFAHSLTNQSLQKFPKKERLSGKKAIGELFKKGTQHFAYPFKVLIHNTKDTGEGKLRLLITVPKRNFKKAIDRNHIKRLVREAWRLHKFELLQQTRETSLTVDVALIYTPKTIITFKELSPKIILILHRLLKENEVRNTTSD